FMWARKPNPEYQAIRDVFGSLSCLARGQPRPDGFLPLADTYSVVRSRRGQPPVDEDRTLNCRRQKGVRNDRPCKETFERVDYIWVLNLRDAEGWLSVEQAGLEPFSVQHNTLVAQTIGSCPVKFLSDHRLLWADLRWHAAVVGR